VPISLRHSCGSELTDKEFRYLRTVIVTAAVYWGFISKLAPLHLTFQHRAGVSPYTSSFDLAQTVFLINSCMALLLRPPKGQTLSRSYGRYIAEFLNEVLSYTLVYSTEHRSRFAVRAAMPINSTTFPVSLAHQNQPVTAFHSRLTLLLGLPA